MLPQRERVRVKKRIGHTSYAMLARYDHESDDRNIGQLFPPLSMRMTPTEAPGSLPGSIQQNHPNRPGKNSGRNRI
jgi:hypothetical protein